MMVMPVVWLLIEYFRGYWVLNGFPWLQIGYSQLETPLAGYIPVTGVYGTGFLVALTASVIVFMFQTRKHWLLLTIVLAAYMDYRQCLADDKMDACYRRPHPRLIDSRQYQAGSKVAAGK